MSLHNLTRYYFSNQHGITGTLAEDPMFAKTKDGDDFAKFAIYCKAINDDDKHKKYRRHKQADTKNAIPLIAYVRVFDDDLFDAVDALKQGYFVNFTFDDVIWNVGDDEKTDERRVYLTFVANSLAIRHIPEKKKSQRSKRNPNLADDERKRPQRMHSRYQKVAFSH